MHRLVRFSLLAAILLPAPAVAEPVSHYPTIEHHQLALELLPDSHQLHATDRLTIAGGSPEKELTFSLAPTLRLDRVEDVTSCQEFCKSGTSLAFTRSESSGQTEFQRIVLKQPSADPTNGLVQLKFSYHGVVEDPPRDPRHLRFVTPSETSGYIGPEGVYLSSESQWYPDLNDSLATYDVTVKVPDGWTAITQGTPQADPARWVVSTKSEALTLVANRFVVKTRPWQAQSGQAIQLAAYLFPDNAALADEYLDAYIPLLGPYPFSKFAVVENFFSSGLGMPSFTLLGSGVIKRHYIQPYALGHEIVHSWMGNGVFNQVSRGNWVEGLTTYLSNYYYHELTGDEAQAREQRRLMLMGYSVYIRSGDDYPLEKFVQKNDEKDNAIGYQKSAMVFHLLRQEVGDDVFWRTLKQIPEQFLGAVIEWKDLERTFQKAAGRDLRWFFAQWIERAGAPELALSQLRVQPAHGTSGQASMVEAAVHIVQREAPYRVPVELEFMFAGGRSQRVRILVVDAQQDVIVPLSERPLAVRLDPGYHLFRRVARRDMAPMLNLYITDSVRTVVLPHAASSDQSGPFGAIVQRIAAQEAAKPAAERTAILQPEAVDTHLPEGSLLMLGDPRNNPTASKALRYCGDQVRLSENGFSVQGTTYEGPTMALLVSCRREDHPDSMITWLYGVTPQALGRVSRLLFFYGWQSYVVFRDGTVTARGDWEDTMSAGVQFETE
ncbi:MAG: hypothetical protein M3M98_01655 [Nitrospirota bacterium]|nr:hypothetical protein [Nitrospirota bacterium]